MSKNTKVQFDNLDEFACTCGCGIETKSTYRPGHDAKHVSILLAGIFARRNEWGIEGEDLLIELAEDARAQLPSTALKVKFNNAFARRIHREFDSWSDKVNRGKNPQAPFSFHPDDFFARYSRVRGAA